jgi:hypothetical protein
MVMNSRPWKFRHLDRTFAATESPEMAFDTSRAAITLESLVLIWFHRSGELLSRSRIAQILEVAEKKLRVALTSDPESLQYVKEFLT